MSPLASSLVALACVFGGALLGLFFGRRLPDKHRAPESKDVVRLAMGLVVTTVALALGLLVGSAKSFYDTQNAEMTQIAADFVYLDRILSYYGPEASGARAELRILLADLLEHSGQRGISKVYSKIKSGARVGESDLVLEKIQQLSPKDDYQRFLKQQALTLEFQLGETRWLMFAQNAVPFPKLLLVMLIFWLIALFLSFGIFGPRNPLVLAGLFVSATAVCGAILLILAMYHPQGKLIRVSDAPLRAAMQQIGP